MLLAIASARKGIIVFAQKVAKTRVAAKYPNPSVMVMYLPPCREGSPQ